MKIIRDENGITVVPTQPNSIQSYSNINEWQINASASWIEGACLDAMNILVNKYKDILEKYRDAKDLSSVLSEDTSLSDEDRKSILVISMFLWTLESLNSPTFSEYIPTRCIHVL